MFIPEAYDAGFVSEVFDLLRQASNDLFPTKLNKLVRLLISWIITNVVNIKFVSGSEKYAKGLKKKRNTEIYLS